MATAAEEDQLFDGVIQWWRSHKWRETPGELGYKVVIEAQVHWEEVCQGFGGRPNRG